jgi:hypothetical protein
VATTRDPDKPGEAGGVCEADGAYGGSARKSPVSATWGGQRHPAGRGRLEASAARPEGSAARLEASAARLEASAARLEGSAARLEGSAARAEGSAARAEGSADQRAGARIRRSGSCWPGVLGSASPPVPAERARIGRGGSFSCLPGLGQRYWSYARRVLVALRSCRPLTDGTRHAEVLPASDDP